jgi:hypothetical protein
MDMGKKLLKQRASNFCWMHFSLLASVNVLEFETTEAYSSSSSNNNNNNNNNNISGAELMFQS